MSRARELTPVLVQNSASILESMGLKTTAKNLTLGYNLKGGANISSGLFSDIKRIDNKTSDVNGLLEYTEKNRAILAKKKKRILSQNKD